VLAIVLLDAVSYYLFKAFIQANRGPGRHMVLQSSTLEPYTEFIDVFLGGLARSGIIYMHRSNGISIIALLMTIRALPVSMIGVRTYLGAVAFRQTSGLTELRYR
jgi:hypothetical protein